MNVNPILQNDWRKMFRLQWEENQRLFEELRRTLQMICGFPPSTSTSTIVSLPPVELAPQVKSFQGGITIYDSLRLDNLSEVAEDADFTEVAESPMVAKATEITEVAKFTKAVKIATVEEITVAMEVVGVAEFAEAAKVAAVEEIVVVVDFPEVAEAVEAVEVAEALDFAKAAEVSDLAEVAEVTDLAEVAEAAEGEEIAVVAEGEEIADRAEVAEAKMMYGVGSLEVFWKGESFGTIENDGTVGMHISLHELAAAARTNHYRECLMIREGEFWKVICYDREYDGLIMNEWGTLNEIFEKIKTLVVDLSQVERRQSLSVFTAPKVFVENTQRINGSKIQVETGKYIGWDDYFL